MKILLSFALIAALATAAEHLPLEQTVGPLRFEKTPLPAALRALGRTGKTMIQTEPLSPLVLNERAAPTRKMQ